MKPKRSKALSKFLNVDHLIFKRIEKLSRFLVESPTEVESKFIGDYLKMLLDWRDTVEKILF